MCVCVCVCVCVCGFACLVCLILCAACTLQMRFVCSRRNICSAVTGFGPATVVLLLLSFCVFVNSVVVPVRVYVCGGVYGCICVWGVYFVKCVLCVLIVSCVLCVWFCICCVSYACAIVTQAGLFLRGCECNWLLCV